jgi:asparaginyl-tRNA synthetase
METINQERLAVMKFNGLLRSLENLSASEMKRKQCISRIMTHILQHLTQQFVKEKFEWLLPVIFSNSTDPLWPDPDASIEKRIEVEIYGRPVRATLSMIVHKMVSCSLAYPKLFTLSPNIRIEKPERANSGVHAYEFTQLDFEVRNATSNDVRRLVERLVTSVIKSLKREMREELTCLNRYEALKIPKYPFKQYDKKEVETKIGCNWEVNLKREIRNPVWITNMPREFYDFTDFESDTWDNYDLLLPEYGEVLSGSRREWNFTKLISKMEKDGVEKETYSVLLKLAKQGRLKPSAGAGIGIERLTSWIVGAAHIGEIQPFPRIPGIVGDL